MGVPGFAKWLLKKYPQSTYYLSENNIHKIDCLYLDMNGILYKCAKDEKVMFKDLLIEKNFDELWVQIFNYINNIVNQVEPTKILFLALDGPAPRAKQNQQRSRRFQSAKAHAELNKSLKNCGFQQSQNIFQNNCISPGTQFMHELNKQLKFYIATKFKEDQKWQNLKVIFSGSNVPGEGEHKILAYIRQYTNSENYNINTSHCIYGADADLIMLGLSTHIPYFSILRETMPFQTKTAAPAVRRKYEDPEFQIINLYSIRKHMDREFSQLRPKLKHLDYSINRIIDDFILLCFFIGNDFLPKCYCFDIRQGNVGELIQCYKDMLINSKCYINEGGQINWKGMEQLLELLSTFEQKLISIRASEVQDKQSKEKINKNEDEIQLYQIKQKEMEFLQKLQSTFKIDSQEARIQYYKEKLQFDPKKDPKQLQSMLKSYVEGMQFVLKYYYQGVPSWSWYYPFYYSPMVTDLLNYVKYHNSQEQGIQISFEKSQPYEPLKQLLCILHPENHALLPPQMSQLLTSKNSPLRTPFDYYPNNFKIDPFGAIWEHEYIVILPFLPQEVLNQALEFIDISKLSDYDKSRNQFGQNIIYYLNSNSQRQVIKSTLPYYKDIQLPLQTQEFYLDQDLLSSAPQNQLNQNQQISIFPSVHSNDRQQQQNYYQDIQEEFPIGSQVLVFHEQYLGNKGIVKDYQIDEQQYTNIVIEMQEKPEYFNDDTYNQIVNENITYNNISKISKDLNINPQILLSLLDEVIIILDNKSPSSANLQKKLNISLRLISRFKNQIVPEHVRFPPDYNYNFFPLTPQQQNQLEITEESTLLLKRYCQKLQETNILDLIEIQAQNERISINIQDVYFKDKQLDPNFDPNIEITKLYVWVLQNSNNLPLYPLNSYVLYPKTVQQIQNQNKILSSEIKIQEPFDPDLLIKYQQYIPNTPFQQYQNAFYHHIGDRVIYINDKQNTSLFGAYGTVVGIISNQVQVVFDKPYIAGTNLGGKCTWLHGFLLENFEVFNLVGAELISQEEEYIQEDQQEDNIYQNIAQYDQQPQENDNTNKKISYKEKMKKALEQQQQQFCPQDRLFGQVFYDKQEQIDLSQMEQQLDIIQQQQDQENQQQ